MSVGVVTLNFGEPGEPDRDTVEGYLERIFFSNADLEEYESEEAARERARSLAKRRTPALIEEYEEIGGSPLNEQARAHTVAIEDELRNRGYDVTTYMGMQYMPPFIDDAVSEAYEDGVETLIGLPLYPLCGPSTNVLALDDLDAAIADRDWDVDVQHITGWHRHPTYNRVRAENIRSYIEDVGVSLQDDETAMVFSAHGTPTHYLEEGSRYDQYVEEYCAVQASLLNVDAYSIGFQNHANRGIEWTEPELEDLVEDIDAARVVVEPISFLNEQSETLSELDIELVEDAIDPDQELYRVPIPTDDSRMAGIFADLLEPLIADFDPGYYQLRQCQCRNEPGTVCLNAPEGS